MLHLEKDSDDLKQRVSGLRGEIISAASMRPRAGRELNRRSYSQIRHVYQDNHLIAAYSTNLVSTRVTSNLGTSKGPMLEGSTIRRGVKLLLKEAKCCET